MPAKVFRQESKEFQLKVRWPIGTGDAPATPGQTDRQIFRQVSASITTAVQRLAGSQPSELRFVDNRWRREALRFDTAGHDLKQRQLTLAIEATAQRTKLKCKQHSLVPELLFEKPAQSLCYPDSQAAGGYKKHDTKLKREQDIHCNNVKYCASGSLFIKGRHTSVQTVDFFSRYFPALRSQLPTSTPLQVLTHWDESVFDQMQTRWNKTEICTWMLVIRRDRDSQTLLESELSFKVDKPLAAAWDYAHLHQASLLYLELLQTGAFLDLPPIFFYADPVTAIPIRSEAT